ncbi:hypothetical protein AMJ74_00790 [candidate division WOR_3 bacterium SM1_77]|uniref:Uncharacterized protein n=1 Tax=candidate division WOR_3 bacterium SM1_77 TaxID=1703778 RepID=A0A0S8K1B6_UNCW3|nr:MAG: hypothetical protein AMJ74_00790 [candidate division WOR_3 bacterium SM1_77]
MYRPFLIGQKLYLHALEESDVCEEYIKWLNDAEVTRYMLYGNWEISVNPRNNPGISGKLSRQQSGYNFYYC